MGKGPGIDPSIKKKKGKALFAPEPKIGAFRHPNLYKDS
jgi:hypothetical protein